MADTISRPGGAALFPWGKPCRSSHHGEMEAAESSTSPRTPSRDRHVLAAILLGVLVPGLGQAYAGYTIRACLWFVGAVGLGTMAVHALLTNQRPPLNLALPMTALLADSLVHVVYAARLTRRQASAHSTPPSAPSARVLVPR